LALISIRGNFKKEIELKGREKMVFLIMPRWFEGKIKKGLGTQISKGFWEGLQKRFMEEMRRAFQENSKGDRK
jgi:hypothetical protein